MLTKLVVSPRVGGSRILFPGVMSVKPWWRLREVGEVVFCLVRNVLFVYIGMFVRGSLWCMHILCSCFTSREVARMLFETVCTFRTVLFWFMAYTWGLVSATFDTFWSEISTLKFMNEVLTSAALERAAPSNIAFCVPWSGRPTLRVFCPTAEVRIGRHSLVDLRCKLFV
jgi:hypothetical protein